MIHFESMSERIHPAAKAKNDPMPKKQMKFTIVTIIVLFKPCKTIINALNPIHKK